MGRNTQKKGRRASTYRSIENLALWIMDICKKVPKCEPFKSQVKRINDEFVDALACCEDANDTPVLEEKLELIKIMRWHLKNTKVVVRLWHQYSLRNTDIKKILSEKQIAHYLEESALLGLRVKGWTNSILVKQKQGFKLDPQKEENVKSNNEQ